MMGGLVEVVVGPEHFLARAPVHVGNQFFQPTLDSVLAASRILINDGERLGDIPMPRLVDVHVESSLRTRFLPVVGTKGRNGPWSPPLAQKQRYGVQIHRSALRQVKVIVQGVTLRINGFALSVEVASEQFHRLFRKPHKFGPPSAAAFVACPCSVFQATTLPIAEREGHDLRHPCAGLKQETQQAFLA